MAGSGCCRYGSVSDGGVSGMACDQFADAEGHEGEGFWHFGFERLRLSEIVVGKKEFGSYVPSRVIGKV